MDIMHFECDYLEGAHPKILERLVKSNFEKTPGYGLDKYCESAKEKIRAACNRPDAEVWFMSGGTQTNATVIDGLLRGGQGVVAVDTGHINVHEAGAIEASGHKVIALPNENGKLSAVALSAFLDKFDADETREHTVAPGAVYISHPTEYGTLYTKSELAKLSRICRARKLPLFLDGARLGYGLAAYETDVTLFDIARLCDVFYIGGTKVGALFGEAVVITKKNLIPHFFTLMKRHGALVAKGRMLGIQFDALFTDDLYFKIARNAIDAAMLLRKGLMQKGYAPFIDSPTNQQFFIVENKRLAGIKKSVGCENWGAFDDAHTVIRLATSWATKKADIEKLLKAF